MRSISGQMKPKVCDYRTDDDMSDDEDDEDFLNNKSQLNGDESCGEKKRKGSAKQKLGPKMLFCDECQPIRQFKKQFVLDSHKRLIHPKRPKLFECKECNKEFATQNQLLVHQTLYSHKRSIV